MTRWQLALQQLGRPATDLLEWMYYKYCGKGFRIPRNTNKMFCSQSCGDAYRNMNRRLKRCTSSSAN